MDISAIASLRDDTSAIPRHLGDGHPHRAGIGDAREHQARVHKT